MNPRRAASRLRSDPTIDWLLTGDPSIRWQTLALLDQPDRAVARERAKVAREGWGARLLAKQGRSGAWGGGSSDGGLYTPKWTSTTYTMLLLRDLGLPANSQQARKGCRLLLDHGLQPDGGINYGTWAKWIGRGETCITGMVLSILSHFELRDDRLDTVADRLLEEQMPDGGWNCRRDRGATHSSMHTTINALEGLRLYRLHRKGAARAVRAAEAKAREFLLAHRLFRSHRTGEVIKPAFIRFAFPPRWHYDVLRALDWFQAVDAPRDPRLAEPIDLVRSRRRAGGDWPLESRYPGKTHFEMERVTGSSRWNTLRALRVLKWWDGSLERSEGR
jgi:hypothetical protein